jgi:hypothetical protein
MNDSSANKGRHCTLCGKPGGTAATLALRALGYDLRPDEIGYAHASCIARRKRKLQTSGFPK